MPHATPQPAIIRLQDSLYAPLSAALSITGVTPDVPTVATLLPAWKFQASYSSHFDAAAKFTRNSDAFAHTEQVQQCAESTSIVRPITTHQHPIPSDSDQLPCHLRDPLSSCIQPCLSLPRCHDHTQLDDGLETPSAGNTK